MNIETKYNVGDTVFCYDGGTTIKKVTVDTVEINSSVKEGSITNSIYYRLRPNFSGRFKEIEIMSREEAIRKFETDRSEAFLKLFA